jgi:hypothetical protein
MNYFELSRQLVWIAAWGIVAAFCLFNLYRNRPIFWQETNVITDSKK